MKTRRGKKTTIPEIQRPEEGFIGPTTRLIVIRSDGRYIDTLIDEGVMTLGTMSAAEWCREMRTELLPFLTAIGEEDKADGITTIGPRVPPGKSQGNAPLLRNTPKHPTKQKRFL